MLQVCTGALQQGRGRANKPWAGVEAAMSLRLEHGSVVRTFKHTVVLLQVRTCRHSRQFCNLSAFPQPWNPSGEAHLHHTSMTPHGPISA